MSTATQSQRQHILDWLLGGNTLTPLQALDKFKCFRLAGRVCELRDEGWAICKEMVRVQSGGETKWVAEYWMAEGTGNA